MKHASTIIATLIIILLSALALAVEPPEISPEEARLNAGMTLIRQVVFDDPLLEEWTEVSLGDATLIYDPNGEALLYEFPVRQAGREVGRVHASANPLFGVGAPSVERSQRDLDVAEQLVRAHDRFEESMPGAELIACVAALVRHPRQGVLLEYRLPGEDETHIMLLDMESLEPIADEGRDERGDEENPPGTPMVISMFEQINDEFAPERREAYSIDQETNLRLADALVNELGIDPRLAEPVWRDQWFDIREVLLAAGWDEPQTRVVSGGPLSLIKQQESDWCTRAVAQMIELFHTGSIPRTQKQIDTILNNHGWETNWTSALSYYFQQLPPYMVVDHETNLTVATAANSSAQEQGLRNLQREIDGNRPFSDNIYGHSRMGMAYKVEQHNAFTTRFSIGVYDPEPTFGGIRWELGWNMTGLGVGFTNGIVRHYPTKISPFSVWTTP